MPHLLDHSTPLTVVKPDDDPEIRRQLHPQKKVGLSQDWLTQLVTKQRQDQDSLLRAV